MEPKKHTPVLPEETLDLLNLQPGMNAIDLTLGLGGHSRKIIQAIGPQGKLLAFEQDEDNLKAAKKNLQDFAEQIIFVHRNFEHLTEEVKRHNFHPIHTILMDLGLSSPHVESAERGFSFQQEGPLDMRFDQRQQQTAKQVLNRATEKELANIFYMYGEEKRAKPIARKIVEVRNKEPIKTTTQLAEIIQSISPRKKGHHPATKVFQALRIYVNRELDVLEKTLEDAIDLLSSKGRIAVISYHSLEDRIVKQIFKKYAYKPPKNKYKPKNVTEACQSEIQKKLYLLTKKPIIPSGIEVLANPRSRSAKLRVAEHL